MKERILYFTLGFLTCFTFLILYNKSQKPLQIPVLKIKEKIIRDTIEIENFKKIYLPETLYLNRPFIWKLWTYKDSLIKVQFETDTFRNFYYEILKKERIIFKTQSKEKQGALFLLANREKTILGIDYKFLSLGFEYSFKTKRFNPLLGFKWRF
jgi:hypothetical protein